MAPRDAWNPLHIFGFNVAIIRATLRGSRQVAWKFKTVLFLAKQMPDEHTINPLSLPYAAKG